MRNVALRALSVAVGALVLSASADAATYTWSSTATNGGNLWWGKSANWGQTGNLLPVAGDQAYFNELTGINKTVQLTENGQKQIAAVAGDLYFSGTGWLIQPYITSGGAVGTLTLDTNNIATRSVISVASLGGATISGPILGPRGFSKMGAGTLTLTNTTNNYSGLADVQDGFLALGESSVLPDASSVTVSGGTLSMGSYSDTVAGVTLSSGSITGTGTLTSNSAFDVRSGTAAAVLGGTSGLNKNTVSTLEGGTVTLSGANTYSGDTTINAGTLIVSGSIVSASTVKNGGTLSVTGSTSAAVTVESGGTLTGTGTVGTGSATNLTLNGGGVVAPGTGLGTVGTLTVNGAASLSGEYAVTLASAVVVSETTPYGTSDKLVVTGNASFGDFKVNLQGIGISAPSTPGQVYEWLVASVANNSDPTGITIGTISGMPQFADFEILYRNSTYVSGGRDVIVRAYSSVPEATTMLLGLAGLAPVLMQRRGRKSA